MQRKALRSCRRAGVARGLDATTSACARACELGWSVAGRRDCASRRHASGCRGSRARGRGRAGHRRCRRCRRGQFQWDLGVSRHLRPQPCLVGIWGLDGGRSGGAAHRCNRGPRRVARYIAFDVGSCGRRVFFDQCPTTRDPTTAVPSAPPGLASSGASAANPAAPGSTVVTTVGGTVQQVTGTVGGTVQQLTGTIGGAAQQVTGAFGTAVGGPAGAVVGSAGTAVGSVVTGAGDALAGTLGALGGATPAPTAQPSAAPATKTPPPKGLLGTLLGK